MQSRENHHRLHSYYQVLVALVPVVYLSCQDLQHLAPAATLDCLCQLAASSEVEGLFLGVNWQRVDYQMTGTLAQAPQVN